MIDSNTIKRLSEAFPKSFIDTEFEFIAHVHTNSYFLLLECETELDVKCKVLEWLSREAYKACPFRTDEANDKFHAYILDGINRFLETNFTTEDMEIIYPELGNCVCHQLTIDFVKSGYDMSVLRKDKA